MSNIPEPRLEPPEGGNYACPLCGELFPQWFIRDLNGDLLGCNDCLEQIEPEQYYDLD